MMSFTILALLVSAAYVALAAVSWLDRPLWLRGSGNSRCTQRLLLTLPLLGHALLLYFSILAGGKVNFGISNALSLILWQTLLVYWFTSFFYDIEGLQVLALPLAAVAVLIPAWFPSVHTLNYTGLTLFKLHLVMAMLAYSLLTIAALHALLMAWLERRLHHPDLPGFLQRMPPLLTMETMLFRVIWAGFVLLGLTLLSGTWFSEELLGSAWRWNHKSVFALISWLIFAALLFGRHRYGWRGRKAVRLTLLGFGMLLLAYLGSKFVLEILLQR